MKVFDHRLYIDDISTPLSITMKKATVIRVYQVDKDTGYRYSSPVGDVKFDYRPNEISKRHFINSMEEIPPTK